MVSISQGNSKMGQIRSVSLPPETTCTTGCKCAEKCYARRIEKIRPNVRSAYLNNYEIYINDSETYWREIEASIMMSRFFRYHVAGDIPDCAYLAHMIDIAYRNPHCEILCFTKKYSLINDRLDLGTKFPKNLHIIFSAWRGMEMINPYNLPEAHVRYKDGYCTASTRKISYECEGNCQECAVTHDKCWNLKNGEQIILKEH